jgi:predicted small integral membrane protein
MTDAAPFEVAWTALSVVALLALLGALSLATANLRWVHRTYPRDPLMRTTARAFQIILCGQATLPVAFMIAGILAMQTPPNPAQPASVAQIGVAVAFMLANVVLVAVAIGKLWFMFWMRQRGKGRWP